jgi:outer membrane protein assembly factor BamB
MKEDWSHNRLAGYTGSCVLLGGALYAVDARGILKCLDWETGEVRWAERGFDERGTLIAAGDQLLVQTGASGELAVVAVDPARFRELRRMKVFEGEPATFTSPVFAEGRVYCRSYAGEVVCVDVWGAAP